MEGFCVRTAGGAEARCLNGFDNADILSMKHH